MFNVLTLIIRLFTFPYRRWKNNSVIRQFSQFGEGSSIGEVLRIQGGESIIIGKRVTIHEMCWLAAAPLTGENKANLVISDGSVIGDYNHFWATKSIIIEKDVLTANHVYISDNLHGYDYIEEPILKQPIVQLKEVRIGEGSWIGENVCIMGATIGKHCVIGANAVVTKDSPDYSVAVGIPAKVIKRYNFENNTWEIVK